MRVPIRDQSPVARILGVYDTGLNADWLVEKSDLVRGNRVRFWTVVISGMSGLMLLSSIVVVRVTQHTAKLEHDIEVANARRVSEMHELVLGVAHEIRNPLNAIRLNLHTVGQVFRDEAALGDEEIATMLDEMEGVAEGSGLPYDAILLENTFLTLAEQPDKTALLRLPARCTNVVALGEATSMGQVLHASTLAGPTDMS